MTMMIDAGRQAGLDTDATLPQTFVQRFAPAALQRVTNGRMGTTRHLNLIYLSYGDGRQRSKHGSGIVAGAGRQQQQRTQNRLLR